MGVASASAAPAPPRKRWQGRFTPIGKMKKGGSAAALPEGCFAIYRKDTKGSTAHSVRDRLTAPLAKRMRLKRGQTLRGLHQ